MTRKVELDGVLLTPQAVDAWTEASTRIINALKTAGVPVDPNQIGEEYAELDEQSGTLTIKCQIGSMTASLAIPKDQWSWNN